MFTLALLLACSSPEPAPPVPVAPPARTLQLSFEAIPGNGFDIHGRVYDTAAATYEQKSAFTETILSEVVPDVFSAVAVDPHKTQQQLSPGGFELQTSPSLQIRGDFAPEQADELAAALGWSTYQWSVLVTDFDAKDGGTGYATVAFDKAPEATLAQDFFVHASTVNKALGGGYTAFGSELTFLNLRGPDGLPYSGVDDATFVADLGRAAASFTAAPVRVTASGQLGAHLVENHWDSAAEGQDYLKVIPDADEPKLPPLRAEFVERLEAAADQAGWSQPAPQGEAGSR